MPNRRQVVWAVAWGGYVPSTRLCLLGAAVATTVPTATDPISGLPHAFHGWFLALRRGRYDSRSLLNGRAGIYWRNGGVHVPGLLAQAIGMLAAASWLDTTVWKGPLSTATNGADFSVFMGALFGGGVYFLMARRRVPAETVRARPSPD